MLHSGPASTSFSYQRDSVGSPPVSFIPLCFTVLAVSLVGNSQRKSHFCIYSFQTCYSASYRSVISVSYLYESIQGRNMSVCFIKSMGNVIYKQTTMSFEDCEHWQLAIHSNLGKWWKFKETNRKSPGSRHTSFVDDETTYF